MSRKFNSAAFTAAWNNPDLTTDDIAAMFGVYRTSVSHMGQRRGLPPRKTGAKPKIDREPFVSLWLAGVSTLDIAKHQKRRSKQSSDTRQSFKFLKSIKYIHHLAILMAVM